MIGLALVLSMFLTCDGARDRVWKVGGGSKIRCGVREVANGMNVLRYEQRNGGVFIKTTDRLHETGRRSEVMDSLHCHFQVRAKIVLSPEGVAG